MEATYLHFSVLSLILLILHLSPINQRLENSSHLRFMQFVWTHGICDGMYKDQASPNQTRSHRSIRAGSLNMITTQTRSSKKLTNTWFMWLIILPSTTKPYLNHVKQLRLRLWVWDLGNLWDYHRLSQPIEYLVPSFRYTGGRNEISVLFTDHLLLEGEW